MQEESQITVVLADDHAIVREGIAALCASNGLRILGQCSDGPGALETILNLKPDFAILDLHMPVMTGVEVVRRLRGAGCPTKLMILSISRKRKLRDGSPACRRGCLPAEGRPVPPSAGCHQLYAGRGSVRLAATARCRYVHQTGTARAEDPLAALSPREMEVFSYLVKRVARQRHRRTAGNQPQDRRHLSCQPDAQIECPRPGGTGEVRDRAKPYEHFRSEIGSSRLAGIWEADCR